MLKHSFHYQLWLLNLFRVLVYKLRGFVKNWSSSYVIGRCLETFSTLLAEANRHTGIPPGIGRDGFTNYRKWQDFIYINQQMVN